jgi:hypothetical protein
MKHSRLSISPAYAVLLVLLVGPALVAGCAKSPMINVWKDPSYKLGPMKKVFAVAVRKEPVRRRIWEDTLVEELGSHGVTAASSYTLFPVTAPDSLQFLTAVGQGAYDGIIVSVRLPNVTEQTYVPGYTKMEPVTFYGSFLHQYATYWRQVQVPAYTETNEVRRFETDVWTTGDGGRLIWSGTIETSDAAPAGTVAQVIHNQIVTALVEAGILPPKAK